MVSRGNIYSVLVLAVPTAISIAHRIPVCVGKRPRLEMQTQELKATARLDRTLTALLFWLCDKW